MWSFWTAFEHGFDENALKCAQTRTDFDQNALQIDRL